MMTTKAALELERKRHAETCERLRAAEKKLAGEQERARGLERDLAAERQRTRAALDHAGEVREDVRSQEERGRLAQALEVVAAYLEWTQRDYVPPERLELVRRARALVGR